MDEEKIVSGVMKELKSKVDPKYKVGAKNFFKEEITLYGVRFADIDKVSADFFEEIKDLDFYDVLKLCEKLLNTGYFENVIVAFEWAYKLRKKFKEKDFEIFEGWLKRYVNNWAFCDNLCNHVIGYFVENFPSKIPRIKSWSSSNNRWLRRASAVSFIIPAKYGRNLRDVLDVSEKLLIDGDDLVQKGYGWTLKEASRKHQKEVFDFVVRHKDVMPRTALRYAIEKMPEKLRKKAMKR
jgi:3-methyladenine DNA glycosylase AlkD